MDAFARYDVPDGDDAGASADSGGGGLKTQVFHLQYLDKSSEAFITSAVSQLYPLGETSPVGYLDGTSRTFVITTSLKYLRKIEKLLARIDVRPSRSTSRGKSSRSTRV